MNNFSVLMSIYYKEKPEYFERAMISIWDEQSIKPSEIVLVEDGPLTRELYDVVKKWKNKLGEKLKIVSLEQNIGLGGALNEGLKYCSCELVARMDTDDISIPDRFKKQLKVFENMNVDVCGGWISEFDKDENKIISYRKVPEFQNEIIKFAKKRNPLNHVSVMFKRSSVEKVGGYKKMMWSQDYHLWCRMILNGAKFYNLQEPLVKVRSGFYQLKRRKGLKYAIAELKLIKELRKLNFLNNFEFIQNILIRLTVRMLPMSLLRVIYKIIRGNLCLKLLVF